MFERIKPHGELNVRKIEVNPAEEDVDCGRPRVRLLHEIKRYSLA